MLYYGLKVILTSIIVVAVAEISKRSTLIGGILASLPLVSILAMIWLYIDTANTDKISHLSKYIFWLVLPSLSLFIALPVFLKWKVNFYLSLFISTTIMVILYLVMVLILKKFNINITE